MSLYLVYRHCIFTDAGRVAPIRAQCPGTIVLYIASNLLFNLSIWFKTQALMGTTRPASGIKVKAHRQKCNYCCLWAFIWCIGIVAPIRAQCPDTIVLYMTSNLLFNLSIWFKTQALTGATRPASFFFSNLVSHQKKDCSPLKERYKTSFLACASPNCHIKTNGTGTLERPFHLYKITCHLNRCSILGNYLSFLPNMEKCT